MRAATLSGMAFSGGRLFFLFEAPAASATLTAGRLMAGDGEEEGWELPLLGGRFRFVLFWVALVGGVEARRGVGVPLEPVWKGADWGMGNGVGQGR